MEEKIIGAILGAGFCIGAPMAILAWVIVKRWPAQEAASEHRWEQREAAIEKRLGDIHTAYKESQVVQAAAYREAQIAQAQSYKETITIILASHERTNLDVRSLTEAMRELSEIMLHRESGRDDVEERPRRP